MRQPKRLFEISKIRDFRDLASYILAKERDKIGNSDLTTLNSVQNYEILRLRRGKLHPKRWNMQSYQ